VSTAKKLEDYPRPSVAVDTAVLVVGDHPGELDVLLHRRSSDHHGDQWALPGIFLHARETPQGLRDHETLADAVRRSLEQKVGLTATHPQQLHVFDRPDRDDRGWVLSVAHVVLHLRRAVEPLLEARADVRLVDVGEVADLPFDHVEIVGRAVARVRHEHALRPDPFNLLDDSFTLRRLHELHEAVAPPRRADQSNPSFDTFRRYMVGNGLVERTGEVWQPPSGRPAHLYRRSASTGQMLGAVGVRPIRPARG
jgi:ADP-ribose pyrophosphatase YjhB (NUDIX family)